MFGIDSTELLIIVIVAVVVIGPKDLPRALYKVGKVVGQARAMARHFRTGLDAMIREAELEDLQKQWDRENARIMAQHPVTETMATERPLIDGANEPAEEQQVPAAEQTSAGEDVEAQAPESGPSLADAVRESQLPFDMPAPQPEDGARAEAATDEAPGAADSQPRDAAAS